MKLFNFIINAFVVLAITLSFIILDVKLTLNFKPLYNFDIIYLKIEASSGLKKPEIKANYEYLIQYLNTKKDLTFKLPTIDFSKNGKIHFEEVKEIFVKLDYLLLFSLLVGLSIGFFLYKNHNFAFIKWSALGLFILPAILLFPFLLNFNKSFVLFHKIAFTNQYWEFDPSIDPIINILPEDFFFHCALMILFFIVVESIFLFLLYRKKIQSRKRLRMYS